MDPYRENTKWDEYWNAHEAGVDFHGLKDFWVFLGTQMTVEEWIAKSGAEQQAVYFAWKNGGTPVPPIPPIPPSASLGIIGHLKAIIKLLEA